MKDTPRKKIWGLPERFEHLAPQLEQTVEKQGDWQPCSYGGPGPGARPGCTGLAFGHLAQVCCFSLHLSSPLQGFWVDCFPCPCKPNHQHLPLTSSRIGNPSAAARPGSSSIHSSSEQSVPFFFSAKAAFPLPLSAPSAAKPAAKARFLFPFCFFMVPFIYRLCFFLALAPIQRGREAKGGEQYHS